MRQVVPEQQRSLAGTPGAVRLQHSQMPAVTVVHTFPEPWPFYVFISHPSIRQQSSLGRWMLCNSPTCRPCSVLLTGLRQAWRFPQSGTMSAGRRSVLPQGCFTRPDKLSQSFSCWASFFRKPLQCSSTLSIVKLEKKCFYFLYSSEMKIESRLGLYLVS